MPLLPPELLDLVWQQVYLHQQQRWQHDITPVHRQLQRMLAPHKGLVRRIRDCFYTMPCSKLERGRAVVEYQHTVNCTSVRFTAGMEHVLAHRNNLPLILPGEGSRYDDHDQHSSCEVWHSSFCSCNTGRCSMRDIVHTERWPRLQ